MDVLTLYVGNDVIFEIAGLTDEHTGTLVNNATVTVSLFDSADVAVTGETWPKPMAYLANSDGVYSATLSNAMAVTANARYRAHLTADAGTGRTGSWWLDVVAKTRRR